MSKPPRPITPIKTEEWRPIPGCSSYAVSESGRVRRVKSSRTYKNGFELGGTISPKGYRIYELRSDKGERLKLWAHRVVCEIWNGPRPDGHVTRHLDGDSSNNHYTNLQWGTPADNVADQVRHGTQTAGESHPRAKLNWRAVKEIRAAYVPFKTTRAECKQLADRYGVAFGTLMHAMRGETWKEPREEHEFEAERLKALVAQAKAAKRQKADA